MGALLRLLLLLLVALAVPAQAQTFPKLTGRVVDAANIIPDAEEAAIDAKLKALEDTTDRQLVVATIPNLEGRPVEDYGYRLGRAWGIGQEEANNGALLIVAPNERKVRIEVGYGLEPVLTDALSSVIVNTQIIPQFKAGNLPAGINGGVDAIIEQLRLPPDEARQRAASASARKTQRNDDGGGWIMVAFWGCILLFFILPAIFGRRRGRRYRDHDGPVIIWGGGSDGWSSGGGGFSDTFSGGGGDFGGGGASGDW